MRVTLGRTVAAAATVGALTLTGFTVGAGPAAASDCVPHTNICGVVYNHSRFAIFVAERIDSAGTPGTWHVVQPGEVSTKYLRDTDLYSLLCNGVVVDGGGTSHNVPGSKNIWVSSGETLDVRYQGC